jgi:hypothetical protein
MKKNGWYFSDDEWSDHQIHVLRKEMTTWNMSYLVTKCDDQKHGTNCPCIDYWLINHVKFMQQNTTCKLNGFKVPEFMSFSQTMPVMVFFVNVPTKSFSLSKMVFFHVFHTRKTLFHINHSINSTYSSYPVADSLFFLHCSNL